MKLTSTLFAVVLLAGACKGKDSGTSDDPSKDPARPADPKAAAPEPAKPAPAAVELVEHDLSPFGASFKGYVAMAPRTAKIEFDDPSRHIVLSDVNFIVLDEAPYWEDGIAALSKDKD